MGNTRLPNTARLIEVPKSKVIEEYARIWGVIVEQVFVEDRKFREHCFNGGDIDTYTGFIWVNGNILTVIQKRGYENK